MERVREGNYDLLRIISAIAVITIHVSSTWLGAITNEETFGTLYRDGMLASCAYNVLARFAVPCFVMLSGAFLLADERNADARYFYRKTFRNVGIPTLIFSILYFAYSFIVKILAIVVKGKELSGLLYPIKQVIKGKPFYHMWYLYMMIGVYLLVPAILLLKARMGERVFSRMVWLFLIAACLSYWTSTNKLNWDIGLSFQFTGYLMAGYELRKIGNADKNNKKGILYLALGILTEMIVIGLRYRQALQGIADDDLKYRLVSPLCPLIVIASVLIFAGFSHLTIRRDFGKLSADTFLIYLFHAGIWAVLIRIIKSRASDWDNRILIPCCIVIVFCLSLAAARIYKRLWSVIERKWSVSDRLCTLAGKWARRIMGMEAPL